MKAIHPLRFASMWVAFEVLSARRAQGRWKVFSDFQTRLLFVTDFPSLKLALLGIV